MDLDFRDFAYALLVVASIFCGACAVWYYVNRQRRKRLAPDDEGQASRTAHSIGEAQWSLWRLSTWRWGHLFWASQRTPQSRVHERRHRKRHERRQRYADAAEARGSVDDAPPED